jgi:hypothetical protein
MDTEMTTAQIEWLEELFNLPDERLPRVCERKLASQKHAEDHAGDAWFRLGNWNNR